jgi:flagellar basal-body rod protein FlgF
MDRGLYVAMTGAKQIMQAQAVNNHNIANISTIGFRADAVSFDSQPIYGRATRPASTPWPAMPARISPAGVHGEHRPRSRHVAVNGKGFIAVRGTDGKEAYTRAGDLRVSAAGAVTTASGLPC